MFAAKNLFLTPPTGVAYDATGAGQQKASGNLSYTHVIGSSAKAVCLGVSIQSGSSTPTVKVGTTSMTLATSTSYVGSSVTIDVYAFQLLNPPTGTQTITVTLANGSITNSNSVSYSNVTSFGTAVKTSGTSATPSQTVTTSASGQMIWQMFGSNSSTAMTSYNQTQRYNTWTSGTSYPLILGDAPGASSVTFSAANTGGSKTWVSIAIPLV